jgi:hypothetical protein
VPEGDYEKPAIGKVQEKAGHQRMVITQEDEVENSNSCEEDEGDSQRGDVEGQYPTRKIELKEQYNTDKFLGKKTKKEKDKDSYFK